MHFIFVKKMKIAAENASCKYLAHLSNEHVYQVNDAAFFVIIAMRVFPLPKCKWLHKKHYHYFYNYFSSICVYVCACVC